MTATLRCFTVHGERLERQDVWRRTSALLWGIERCGGRATVFIHPLTAMEAGVDLGSRIRELRSRGHEVAQHTHFYAARRPEAALGADPISLLTQANILRCLDRDLAYLHGAGAEPRGFVAGGWAVSEEALGWLREHGFVYDAGVRSFALSYPNPDAAAGDGWTAPRLEDGLLRLPTTAPLAATARGGGAPVQAGDVAYEMTFVHDYDLLNPVRRLAAAAVLRRWRSGPWTTAAGLARAIAGPRVDG